MHNSVLPQQDFFLYVPSQQPERTNTQALEAIEKQIANAVLQNCKENIYPSQDSWVKIPLAEALTIYARSWNEHTSLSSFC